MHRAKSIYTTLSGKQSQKFASWLLSKGASPAVTGVISTRLCSVPASQESFLSGSSANYVEDMYNAWLKDPASVHAVSNICVSVEIVK